MQIESKELKQSIARQLITGYDPMDSWYNKGITTAMKIIEAYEDAYASAMAEFYGDSK